MDRTFFSERPKDKENKKQNASPIFAAYPLAVDKTQPGVRKSTRFLLKKKEGKKRRKSRGELTKNFHCVLEMREELEVHTMHVTEKAWRNIDPMCSAPKSMCPAQPTRLWWGKRC